MALNRVDLKTATASGRRWRFNRPDEPGSFGQPRYGPSVWYGPGVVALGMAFAPIEAVSSWFEIEPEPEKPNEHGGPQLGLSLRLRDAVNWILNDVAYKAPEQVGLAAERWIQKLREAVEPEPEPEKPSEIWVHRKEPRRVCTNGGPGGCPNSRGDLGRYHDADACDRDRLCDSERMSEVWSTE